MSTGANLAIAYVAGAINATLTCPLWTVSTRLKLVKNTSEAKEKSENENEEGSAGHDVEADDETDTTTATGPDAAEPEASKPRETPVPTTIWGGYARGLHVCCASGVICQVTISVSCDRTVCGRPVCVCMVARACAHFSLPVPCFVVGGVSVAVCTYCVCAAMLLHISRTEGVKSLFRGVPSGLMLCTNPAIQFLVYERLRRRFASAAHHVVRWSCVVATNPPVGWHHGSRRGTLTRRAWGLVIMYGYMLRRHHHQTSLQAFVFGAVAKAVATVLTYPLQVIQARANANVR